jgi:hypothetical protein
LNTIDSFGTAFLAKPNDQFCPKCSDNWKTEWRGMAHHDRQATSIVKVFHQKTDHAYSGSIAGNHGKLIIRTR